MPSSLWVKPREPSPPLSLRKSKGSTAGEGLTGVRSVAEATKRPLRSSGLVRQTRSDMSSVGKGQTPGPCASSGPTQVIKNCWPWPVGVFQEQRAGIDRRLASRGGPDEQTRRVLQLKESAGVPAITVLCLLVRNLNYGQAGANSSRLARRKGGDFGTQGLGAYCLNDHLFTPTRRWVDRFV